MAAGLLYLSFPVHVGFLHTAMTEQLLGAACALALALGSTWSKKPYAWLAGAVVLVAVLLRETALAYFVVLVGLWLSLPSGGSTMRRLVVPVTGLLAGFAVYWIWASDRPSLFWENLLLDEHSAVYLDSFALDGITITAATIVAAMGERLQRNMEILLSFSTLNPEEYAVLGMVLLALIFSLFRGVRQRDWYCLAVGLVGFFAITLLMATYKIEYFKGIRFVAFLWPACCIALASFVSQVRSFGTGLLGIVLLIGISASQSLAAKRAAVCEYWFDQANEQELFLQRNADAKDQIIVAQALFGMSWALGRPGTRWAFMPSNLQTFQLLKDKAGVGLIVLAPGPHQAPMAESLQQEGYVPVDSLDIAGGRYLLMKTEDTGAESITASIKESAEESAGMPESNPN